MKLTAITARAICHVEIPGGSAVTQNDVQVSYRNQWAKSKTDCTMATKIAILDLTGFGHTLSQQKLFRELRNAPIR